MKKGIVIETTGVVMLGITIAIIALLSTLDFSQHVSILRKNEAAISFSHELNLFEKSMQGMIPLVMQRSTYEMGKNGFGFKEWNESYPTADQIIDSLNDNINDKLNEIDELKDTPYIGRIGSYVIFRRCGPEEDNYWTDTGIFFNGKTYGCTGRGWKTFNKDWEDTGYDTPEGYDIILDKVDFLHEYVYINNTNTRQNDEGTFCIDPGSTNEPLSIQLASKCIISTYPIDPKTEVYDNEMFNVMQPDRIGLYIQKQAHIKNNDIKASANFNLSYNGLINNSFLRLISIGKSSIPILKQEIENRLNNNIKNFEGEVANTDYNRIQTEISSALKEVKNSLQTKYPSFIFMITHNTNTSYNIIEERKNVLQDPYFTQYATIWNYYNRPNKDGGEIIPIEKGIRINEKWGDYQTLTQEAVLTNFNIRNANLSFISKFVRTYNPDNTCNLIPQHNPSYTCTGGTSCYASYIRIKYYNSTDANPNNYVGSTYLYFENYFGISDPNTCVPYIIVDGELYKQDIWIKLDSTEKLNEFKINDIMPSYLKDTGFSRSRLQKIGRIEVMIYDYDTGQHDLYLKDFIIGSRGKYSFNVSTKINVRILDPNTLIPLTKEEHDQTGKWWDPLELNFNTTTYNFTLK